MSGNSLSRISLVIWLLASGIPPALAEDEQSGLPLEPARRLSFDVEEGTWVSVDVSPDGNTIVFDLLGDLYEVSSRGGAARRIRDGMAFDAQPIYSPDGSMIAYVSDESGSENLWIAGADGSRPRMLSSDTDTTRYSSPEWAADGNSIYVSRRVGRHGHFGLWQYHVAGGSGVHLTETSDEEGAAAPEILGVAPSSDGNYLYYSGKSTAQATLYSIPSWTIYRRDLKSGATRQVVTALSGAFRPQISPNGEMLVYGTRMDGETGLRRRNLRTGEDRWLAYPVQRDNMNAQFNRDVLPGYAFTPDGDALIAAYGGKLRRIDASSGEVSELPFKAHVDIGIGPSLVRSVPVDSGPVRARLIQDPVQSPDGNRLVFSALARLYIADLPGGQARRLTKSDEPEFQPSWSPDGRWISYVTWDAVNAGHICTIRAGGGAPERLTSVADYYSDPVYAPDGRYIYALRSSHFERMRLQEEVTPKRFADLVRIPSNGGDTAPVVHTGIGAQRPFVTQDLNRVFFTTPDGVASVRGDASDGRGTDEQVHFRVDGLHPWTNAGKPNPVNDVQLSPDGKWVLTIVANQLHLIAAPPQMDGVPVVNLIDDVRLPRIRISRFGADSYAWADDGQAITWSLGPTFNRQSLDSVPWNSDDPQKAQDRSSSVESFEIAVEVPRDVPEGQMLLRGGTAITMNGEEIIHDADILVVNDRIERVGKHDSFPVPERAEVRDISGTWVVPGFVDTHAHWYEIRHGVLDVQNWSFLISLAFGITSGLDVQAMDQDMFAYQDMIDGGLMIGPRAWSVGQGMFENSKPASEQEARDLVARYANFYRTPNVKSYLIGNRQQRQWIVQASSELEVLPTTEGSDDLKLDLTHAIDGFAGNEHALPVVPLYDDVVRLFAETRIGYTPTLMIVSGGGARGEDYFFVTQSPHDDPKVRRFMPHYVNDTRTSGRQWVREEERMYSRVAESAARIFRAGGRLGIGSHAEFQGVAYHWEMEALASGGLSPHEVLRVATDHGSQIIGRAKAIGTLEAGKYADLLVLDKNPLDDIRNTKALRYVMKNGRLYDADTLDELWPRQRELPTIWHQEDRPHQDSGPTR